MLLFFLLLSDDAATFSELYETFRQPLLRLAYSILKSNHLAEEAVQESFIRVFKNLHKITGNERSKTWHFLVIVTKRVSLTMLQKEKKLEMLDIDEYEVADEADSLWSEYRVRELYGHIRAGVLRLSQEDRMILTLRSAHGLAYAEIAAATGLTEKNVSVRLSRIRQKLREMINSEEGEKIGF